MYLIKLWLKLPPWKKIYTALFLGVAAGLLLGPQASILKPIGNLFIRAIHMTVVPVVFVVIVCAVISMEDMTQMRRLSLKAAVIYSVFMLLAAIIGIGVSLLMQPGVGFPFIESPDLPIVKGNTISNYSFIENLIPKSPIAAFAEGNILQIVIFSILLGIAINLAGEKAHEVKKVFKSLSSVVFKLVGIVMSFAPYGIFAYLAWVFGSFGLGVFLPLAKFVLTVVLGCIVQFFIVYACSVWIVVGDSPVVFFKKVMKPLIFALSTCSSAATLPISIKTVQEEWNVSEKVADFLLPLGASFNLNGLTIYLCVATIFAANIFSIQLMPHDYLGMILTIILTTMGIAAVPGSAVVAMSVVMTSVGVPLGALGIILGVDRLNDMVQTSTNVAGDVCATVIAAKLEDKQHASD